MAEFLNHYIIIADQWESHASSLAGDIEGIAELDFPNTHPCKGLAMDAAQAMSDAVKAIAAFRDALIRDEEELNAIDARDAMERASDSIF